MDLPACLFPYQKDLVTWACRRGKAALLADTGMGKAVMALSWAYQIVERTGRSALILAPLAVAAQFVREGEKFGLPCKLASDQSEVGPPFVYVTNYQKLHKFDVQHFAGMVADESSILKSHDGRTRTALIEAFRNTPYRLACTATPAPNDLEELGNHAEFLGVCSRTEMLSEYFVHDGGETQKWRIKGHAKDAFWKWVCSWAAVLRKPEDLGYDGSSHKLPPLEVIEHIVSDESGFAKERGLLFAVDTLSLQEARAARKATMAKRVERAIEIIKAEPDESWIVWGELNGECDAVEKAMVGCVQVSGSDSDEEKEDRLIGFSAGKYKVLVSKSSIAGFGLNWQHCSRMVFLGAGFCYDATTEILTTSGWKRFDSINENDDVATLNPETRFFEWQRPTSIVWQHYVGDMIHFRARAMDLMVTPNHRMWVRKCNGRHPHLPPNAWEIKTAEDLADHHQRLDYKMLTVAHGWEGHSPEFVDIPKSPLINYVNARPRSIEKLPIDVFASLVGWYLSEGHVRTSKGKIDGTIVISQTDIHPDHRERIIATLKATGLPVNFKRKDMYICNMELALFLAEHFGRLSKNMRIPRWVKDWATPQLRILWQAIMDGDGMHTDGVLKGLKSTSPRLIEDCQEIALKLGISTTDRSAQLDTLNIRNDYTQPAINHQPARVPYDGMIGCVSVPNGLVFVRRNGHAVVSGNSFESYYQAIRRCWRFGQKRPVQVHVITSDIEKSVLDTLKRKASEAEEMAERMAANTRNYVQANVKSLSRDTTPYNPQVQAIVPDWLRSDP